ncbi:MAG TPA: sortase [Chloroflexi bacterium]|nr:sortase [Chloroflexota bacterium]
MASSRRNEDNLSQNLDIALPEEKRRHRAALKFKRIAAAEQVLDEALYSPAPAETARESFGGLGGSAVRDWPVDLERVANAGPTDPSPEKPATRKRRRLRDALLLIAEIGALVGSLALVGLMYSRLQSLNREIRDLRHSAPIDAPLSAADASTSATPLETASVATAIDAETSTPTATVTGAISPTMEPTASRMPAPRIVAPVTDEEGAVATNMRMVIPRIQVDAPIVRGDTWEDLKWGIGHRIGSAAPGEHGNMVVSAHNDVYGEIFRDLNRLESGDEVLIHTQDRMFRYRVRSVEIVLPNRIDVMDPTAEPVLTMITCHPYMVNTHRVVVVADLIE